MSETEKELLACMLAAPATEIIDLVPSTAGECATFLGLSENEKYHYRKHYVLVLAKVRREWATAMIAAATGA